MTLALSSAFITAISGYLGHHDSSVRRCGMLAAEIVAQRSGKKLEFGDWDGDDEGKPWAREIRELIKERDVDADLDIVRDAITEPEAIEEISTLGAQQTSASMSEAASIGTATGYDSDDSLTGYASEPSSRSNSPTPSELDEIEKDPTLSVGVKKVSRPVYLAQLGEMIRSIGGLNNEAAEQADKIEMALDYAEELIRKKRDYGTELGEDFCRTSQ